MDIKNLQYFYTIIEQGGISRAARKLHISQPPLSQRLKDLEDELGTQLIIRTKGQWQVTRAGEILYKKAHSLLTQLETLGPEIRKTAESLVGMVRIGVSPPCLPLLEQALPHLHNEFPGLRSRLFVMESLMLENEIQIGNLDFALSILPVQNSSFTAIQLPFQDYLAVYGKGVSVPQKAAVEVDDLDGVPLLLSRRGRGGWEYNTILYAFQKKGLQPNVVSDSQDTRLLVSLLSRGMEAVSILPDVVARSALTEFATRRLDIPGLHFAPVLVGNVEGLTHLAQLVFEHTRTILGIR